MIAACPKCSSRYRVDPARIGPEGARLKCARCEAVFRVRPPAAESAEPAPAPMPEPPVPTRAPAAAPSAPAPRASSDGSGEEIDRERLVVLADPDAEAAKQTAAAIRSWGLQPIIVHDGVEAMLTIQRMLPRAVVLDAALPKMYGFQVCEVIKRNESLRETSVVLLGAIHHKDRYRRPPSDLYGADAYLERPDLPDGLRPVLARAGLPVSSGPAPTAAVESAAAPTPAAAPSAPASAAQAPAAVDDGLEDARNAARRLARIIVSDIVLYNQERFEAAVAAGNVVEAMDGDLEEGRARFAQRVDPSLRDECDFLVEELRRVAAQRTGA